MESKTNYTMVGVIVILLVTGLISACLWLSESFDQGEYNTYVVYLAETVSGLSDDSLVRFNGVKVGQVSHIELSRYNPQHVKVFLKIQKDIPITVSTEATLTTQGITGVTSIGLYATTSTLMLLEKKPGELYAVIPYKSSFLNQLEKDVEALSGGFKKVFTKDNAEHFEKLLANMQSISHVFVTNNQNIDHSLRDLPILIKDLTVTVRSFKVMVEDAKVAGRQVTSTMKAGRNTIDKISQQFVPPAIVLLRRLDLIAANLEKVSADMRANPSVIIRGQAPPQPGPGE